MIESRQGDSMATRVRRTRATEKPTFIFQGTVQRIGATTMAAVPADTRTAIVRVDVVIEAPRDLARWAGQELTVQFGRGPRALIGSSLLFRTVPLIFGDSVLVKSLEQEAVTPNGNRPPVGEPARPDAARDLAEHLCDADLVVSGQVTAVTRLPTERSGVARASRSSAGSPARLSEHDPQWRNATIEVAQVYKGRHTTSTLTVRFPASTDVRWYDAPKFHPGQHGVFVLHKLRAAGRAGEERTSKAALEPDEGPVYTALHPADVRSSADAPHVAKAIAASEKKSPRRNRS
jgi:hypothetical protein